jgi:hypothetical protein
VRIISGSPIPSLDQILMAPSMPPLAKRCLAALLVL